MYAQNNEDDILAAFFGDQAQGFSIDVGAMDGVTGSNTHLFYKRGWSGICVEPNPAEFEKLKQNRKNDICLRCGMIDASEIDWMSLSVYPVRELSTFLPNRGETQIRQIHENLNVAWCEPKIVLTTMYTLNELIQDHCPNTPIDLLSIDTEWMNDLVIMGLNLNRYQPRVIVIEVGDGVREYIAQYSGLYVEAFEHGSNLFYVKPDDIERMKEAYRVAIG